MQDLNETGKYIEDNFELEHYNRIFMKVKMMNARIRTDHKKIRMLSAISIILILFIIFLAYWILNYYLEMKKNAIIYERTHEIVGQEPITQIANQTKVPDISDEQVSVTPDEPVISQPKQIIEKIAELRKVFANDDIVAYLKIDGTNIDYAVAQTTNNEFYLGHDLYAEKNAAGSIFMDFENDMYELDLNTVIYGHNMRNGSMFHNLRYYRDKQYYEEHRYISLTTPYAETTWEIFAFYETGTDFNYIQVVFPGNDSFMSLVSQMKDKSIYDTGVEVDSDDKILTLSTCVNTSEEARFVLNAKLLTVPKANS